MTAHSRVPRGRGRTPAERPSWGFSRSAVIEVSRKEAQAVNVPERLSSFHSDLQGSSEGACFRAEQAKQQTLVVPPGGSPAENSPRGLPGTAGSPLRFLELLSRPLDDRARPARPRDRLSAAPSVTGPVCPAQAGGPGLASAWGGLPHTSAEVKRWRPGGWDYLRKSDRAPFSCGRNP